MKRLGIISHQMLFHKGCMNYGWIVFCGMRDALQEGKIIISDFRRRLIRREWWKMKQIASHIPLAIRLFFWKISQFWWCQIVLTNENDLPKKEFLSNKPLSQNISTNFKFIVPSQKWKHSHPYNFVWRLLHNSLKNDFNFKSKFTSKRQLWIMNSAKEE